MSGGAFGYYMNALAEYQAALREDRDLSQIELEAMLARIRETHPRADLVIYNGAIMPRKDRDAAEAQRRAHLRLIP